MQFLNALVVLATEEGESPEAGSTWCCPIPRS